MHNGRRGKWGTGKVNYFGVDLKVVWKTITTDIPSLKPIIREKTEFLT